MKSVELGFEVVPIVAQLHDRNHRTYMLAKFWVADICCKPLEVFVRAAAALVPPASFDKKRAPTAARANRNGPSRGLAEAAGAVSYSLSRGKGTAAILQPVTLPLVPVASKKRPQRQSGDRAEAVAVGLCAAGSSSLSCRKIQNGKTRQLFQRTVLISNRECPN